MNDFKWTTWNESQSRAPFLDLFFLRFLCEIELLLRSRAPFVDLIFHKCSDMDRFLTIFIWNRALATVSCTFCRPHLPKSALRADNFLRFLCEIELVLQSCNFLSATFPDRITQPRKQKPSLCHHGRPLYLQKHRAMPPRMFSSLTSRVPDLLHFLTTWWWCDCHDDVLDCHDGETASHDNRP